MEVARDVEIGGERCALVVRSRHDGGIEAATVVHRQDFERRIGGVRVVPTGALQEVAHLAVGMTFKSAGAGVAVDGMKCLLVTGASPPPRSQEHHVAALREHIHLVRNLDDGVIFGPDMGSPSTFLARVAADAPLLPHLTGLPTALGGLDINGLGLTAHGVHEAIRTAWTGTPGRALVQGFGAVGARVAELLHADGWRIVGVSTRLGTLEDFDGLDVPRLAGLAASGGDAAVARVGATVGERWTADPSRLLALPAELLVPAARTAAFALPDELATVRRAENPDVLDAVEVIRATGVQMIAEAANHPLTPAAEARLAAEGVAILPDVLVNHGGFVGCWEEWRLRNEPGASGWGGCDLIDRIRRTAASNVRALLEAGGDPRAAADRIVCAARGRLLQAAGGG